MRVLVFGATGSAGGSVLKVALRARDVSEVIAVVRRPLPFTHARLRVITHEDFLDFSPRAKDFANIDACYYALGVSSVQVSAEADYRRITKDFAVAAARVLKAASPNAHVVFISGASTRADSRYMWARVKAEAENELMALVGAACFRPGAIDGEPSVAGGRAWYAGLGPLFKVFAPFRSLYVSGEDLGLAMLQATREGLRQRVIENRDIRDLADRAHA